MISHAAYAAWMIKLEWQRTGTHRLSTERLINDFVEGFLELKHKAYKRLRLIRLWVIPMWTPKIRQNESVKDAVIAILAVTWPLRTKELYPLVKKRGFAVTYQAVHKSLRELMDIDVVVGDRRGYKISRNWINRLNEFAANLRRSYRRSTGR